MKAIVTKKLRDGRTVLAKEELGMVMARTYANITQAEKAAAKLGENWMVTGHRPFFVTCKGV